MSARSMLGDQAQPPLVRTHLMPRGPSDEPILTDTQVAMLLFRLVMFSPCALGWMMVLMVLMVDGVAVPQAIDVPPP